MDYAVATVSLSLMQIISTAGIECLFEIFAIVFYHIYLLYIAFNNSETTPNKTITVHPFWIKLTFGFDAPTYPTIAHIIATKAINSINELFCIKAIITAIIAMMPRKSQPVNPDIYQLF